MPIYLVSQVFYIQYTFKRLSHILTVKVYSFDICFIFLVNCYKLISKTWYIQHMSVYKIWSNIKKKMV